MLLITISQSFPSTFSFLQFKDGNFNRNCTLYDLPLAINGCPVKEKSSWNPISATASESGRYLDGYAVTMRPTTATTFSAGLEKVNSTFTSANQTFYAIIPLHCCISRLVISIIQSTIISAELKEWMDYFLYGLEYFIIREKWMEEIASLLSLASTFSCNKEEKSIPFFFIVSASVGHINCVVVEYLEFNLSYGFDNDSRY